MDILRTQQEELDQYLPRNSVRLTGLPETPDENIYATVMEVFNDATRVTPPLTAVDIDRIYIAGKPDRQQLIIWMQARNELEQDR